MKTIHELLVLVKKEFNNPIYFKHYKGICNLVLFLGMDKKINLKEQALIFQYIHKFPTKRAKKEYKHDGRAYFHTYYWPKYNTYWRNKWLDKHIKLTTNGSS